LLTQEQLNKILNIILFVIEKVISLNIVIK